MAKVHLSAGVPTNAPHEIQQVVVGDDALECHYDALSMAPPPPNRNLQLSPEGKCALVAQSMVA
jgi:hypothetical protein